MQATITTKIEEEDLMMPWRNITDIITTTAQKKWTTDEVLLLMVERRKH